MSYTIQRCLLATGVRSDSRAANGPQNSCNLNALQWKMEGNCTTKAETEKTILSVYNCVCSVGPSYENNTDHEVLTFLWVKHIMEQMPFVGGSLKSRWCYYIEWLITAHMTFSSERMRQKKKSISLVHFWYDLFFIGLTHFLGFVVFIEA